MIKTVTIPLIDYSKPSPRRENYEVSVYCNFCDKGIGIEIKQMTLNGEHMFDRNLDAQAMDYFINSWRDR